jgi:hypothetical protein
MKVMKKMLLNSTILLVSGLFFHMQGQILANEGSDLTLHEARFNIFNYSTKLPVPGAGIFDPSGRQLGLTDSKGKLVLGLSPSAADMYTVKADGFAAVSILLKHAQEASAEYTVFLPESGVIHEDPDGISAQPEFDEAPSETERVKVYVKQDPSNYQKTKNTGDQGVEFAVQLSATSNPVKDKKSFSSWEEIGPVFIQNENGLYKVRIGPYHTQEEAKRVLLQVKAKGRSDAFIVVQKGIENHIPFDHAIHHASGNEPEQLTVTPAPATKKINVLVPNIKFVLPRI